MTFIVALLLVAGGTAVVDDRAFGPPLDTLSDPDPAGAQRSRRGARRRVDRLPFAPSPTPRQPRQMAKLTIPQLKSSSFKGWAFVLVAGGVLTVLALFDRGGTGALLPNQADGYTGCTLEVTTLELNI